MSDKIEYSRLIIKRTDQTGVIPTITSATTLSEMISTDIFSGEFFLNEVDRRLWIRSEDTLMEVGEGTGGGGSNNLDGGMSNSIYAGTTPINGGSSLI